MRWVAALAIGLVLSASARADWGARRDPFDPGVVKRWKAVLARDPYDAGALRQLVGMYRRHRTLAKLEGEYRTRLAAGEDWAALVVLARLPARDATALWKRAVTIRPDDARAWIALGDAARSDAAAARDAYLAAVAAAATPREKRLALTKLVAAAGDHATVDHAYAELIALAPKDGKLWLDRGNAQLVAKQFATARDSFATAEALLRTDPERRLTAMTSQGIALEGLRSDDDAIAAYERALAATPRGYFLGEELVLRIVEVERKRGRLGEVIDRFEQRWPERRRGHFEWALLGDLHAELHREDRALAAYRRAVARGPTEVATQRKLIALLDKLRPDEALSQHEAAARVAPGDAQLQLELARRYYPGRRARALAVLAALARRMRDNVSVRSSIAALYVEWDEPLRAIGEYEAIARLEPGEADHAVVLGEAYWRAHDPARAHAAWKRLDAIGTPQALLRHGEVLALHEAWGDAVTAYTKSLALDAANPDALYSRARAYEELKRYPAAIADARRAVALTHGTALEDGLRNRTLLVRVLDKAYEAGDRRALEGALARWRFAFDRGDVGAGYLLAMHHARIRSHQHHGVLVELYRRAPADDDLGLAVARSYAHRREFDRARTELERIARRSPARAKDIAELIAQVEEDRARVERELRWEEEGRRRHDRAKSPDLAGRHGRVGLRLGVGSDVAGASGALMSIGIYRTHHLARGLAWAWRFDWMKRDGDMLEHKAVAIGGLVATRLLDAHRFELAAGAGPRFELRYGNGIPSSTWSRAALGGDVVLELLPRAVPATLGVRFHHALTDPVRSSSVLLELGFEVR